MNFFGEKATLAQSPQLYKQMCICGGMERVFEVAPAFRAEKANTVRHLCEFISMDYEMEVAKFDELPLFTLRIFNYIFDGLKQRCKAEIDTIAKTYPAPQLEYGEPVLIHFEDACKLLNEGHPEPIQNPMEDIGFIFFPFILLLLLLNDFNWDYPLGSFSTEAEKALGRIIKEKYHTDIYCLVGVCYSPPYSLSHFHLL